MGCGVGEIEDLVAAIGDCVIEDEDDGALGDGVAFTDCVGHLQGAYIRLLSKAHENSRP